MIKHLNIPITAGLLLTAVISLNTNAAESDPSTHPPLSPTRSTKHQHAMPPQSTTHSHMDHGMMDHSKMQHGDMSGMQHDHASMQPKPSPVADGQRDPHAHADGYGFGPMLHDDMGDQAYLASFIADRLESSLANGNASLVYDWQASVGKTYDKLLVRAEGEINAGQFSNARNEVLWAHAISPFWDSQLGIRYDAGKGTDRSWLALGVQGLAPYWIYIEATAYVNEQGRAAFRFETEYDLLITQRLILQPRAELNFYSQADNSRAISSGLSDAEVGLRLRYEIVREFAPYIGVEWASHFGSAAEQLRVQGSAAAETRFVAGIHFWF